MKNRKKQVILLMIPNGQGWYYLAVNKLSALSRGTMSNNHGDAHFLDCLYSFATKRNLNLIKKYVKTKIFVILYNAFQKH